MNKEQFISFAEAQPEPNKHIIVTNNLDSTNAHGEMSHVWMVTHAFQSSKDYEGIIAYVDMAMNKAENLTHWKYA